MHPLSVCILSLLALLAAAASDPTPSPFEVFAAQTKVFDEAVKKRDKPTLLRIFPPSSDHDIDAEIMFLKFHQLKVSLTAESAEFIDENNIEGVIKYSRDATNKPSFGKFTITKNDQSPTGWQFTKIMVGKPEKTADHQPEKRAWPTFSLCWVGYLWCAIEVVIDWQ